MSELLDLLLKPELPNVQKNLPTAKYKMKRLSELAGEDVVFTLRALPYNRINEFQGTMDTDADIQILLAGCVEPDFKRDHAQLAVKYGGETPAETVKAMLLPGEVDDLERAIEKLTGYRELTIEEIKNA